VGVLEKEGGEGGVVDHEKPCCAKRLCHGYAIDKFPRGLEKSKKNCPVVGSP